MRECGQRRPPQDSGRNRLIPLAMLVVIFLPLLLPSACAWSFPFSIPFLFKSDESLEMSLDLGEGSVQYGLPFTYAIQVDNCGSKSIKSLSIKDNFGQIGFLAQLSSGESLTLTRTTPPIDSSCSLKVTISSGDEVLSQKDAFIKLVSSQKYSIKSSEIRSSVNEVTPIRSAVQTDSFYEVSPRLSATVTVTPASSDDKVNCKYLLKNAGDDVIKRVTLIDGLGNILGILNELRPGDSQCLVRSNVADDEEHDNVKVTCIDSTGAVISGTVSVDVQQVIVRPTTSSSSLKSGASTTLSSYGGESGTSSSGVLVSRSQRQKETKTSAQTTTSISAIKSSPVSQKLTQIDEKVENDLYKTSSSTSSSLNTKISPAASVSGGIRDIRSSGSDKSFDGLQKTSSSTSSVLNTKISPAASVSGGIRDIRSSGSDKSFDDLQKTSSSTSSV